MDLLKELITSYIIHLVWYKLKDKQLKSNYLKDIRCTATEMTETLIENFYKDISDAAEEIKSTVEYDMEHEGED